MGELFHAVVLGLVEGATEFIPVSSTGHLILVGDWLGFQGDFAATFEIVIQLGAILAVVWLYRARIASVVRGLPGDPVARRLTWNLALAFVPAAVVGVLAHRWIKAVLFNPVTVASALVLGGIAILVIERLRPRVRVAGVDDLPPRTALGIGIAQVASLVPGVSRSGATIMGGLGLGLSRQAAAEFSFFLAIPVMVAATGFELATTPQILSPDRLLVVAVGFATSFVAALFVVKAFLRFVSHHTFAAFAWYRIAFGLVLLASYLL
ncbi:MAG: undecaprenyl-diphosphate phosphatase [Gemmatimonadota bacterium]